MKKKKSYGKKILCMILLILACLGVLVFLFWDTIKGAAIRKVGTIAIEQAIKRETGWEVDLEEVIDRMDEEDAAAMNDLMDKYFNEENISEGMDILKSGDLNAAKEYIEDKVEPQDLTELGYLYEKYKYEF